MIKWVSVSYSLSEIRCKDGTGLNKGLVATNYQHRSKTHKVMVSQEIQRYISVVSVTKGHLVSLDYCSLRAFCNFPDKLV